MNRNRLLRTARTVALPAALLGLMGAPVAMAQTAVPAATPTTTTAMSFQQVVERIAAQGYNDVREVERKSDKLYEIEARDSRGQRVELYVDARSGEVLREEFKRSRKHD